MKRKLLIVLVVIALAVTAAALLVARQQHTAAQAKQNADGARQRAAAESHDARKNAGEFLVPDTGNDILGDINKQSKRSITPRPSTTPAP